MNSLVSLLTRASAATLISALALAPIALAHDGDHPAGASLDHSVTTGNGTHTFDTHPKWAKFPDGNPIGPTHGGVAIDKSGKVYVTSDGDRGICVFRPNGKFIKSIALDCAGTHSLLVREENGKEYLYGAHKNGDLFVQDWNQTGRVTKLTRVK